MAEAYEKDPERLVHLRADLDPRSCPMSPAGLYSPADPCPAHVAGQRLELAVAAAQEAVWDYDYKTDLFFCPDQRWFQLFGYDPEVLEQGRASWQALIHPDDVGRYRESITAHEESRSGRHESEHRVRHGSGEWMWVSERAIIIERERDGRPRRMVGMVSDISKVKEHEARTLAELRRQKAIADSSPMAMVMVDPDGRVRTWNRTAEQIFGWKEAEAVNRALPILPADEETGFRNKLLAIRDGEVIRGIEVPALRKDGTIIDVMLWAAAAVEPGNSRFHGILLQYADLSERKSLEEQMQQAHKLEAIGKLAGGGRARFQQPADDDHRLHRPFAVVGGTDGPATRAVESGFGGSEPRRFADAATANVQPQEQTATDRVRPEPTG